MTKKDTPSKIKDASVKTIFYGFKSLEKKDLIKYQEKEKLAKESKDISELRK